jgi:hypothetical protein
MNFMEKVRRASKTVVDAGAKQMLKVRFVQQASFSNRNRNRNRDIVACDSKINKKEENYSSLATQQYRSIGGLSPVE